MKQEEKLPNLIIGGAPKSGTSSVYFWLSAHPDVCGSKQKETFYFFDKVNRFNEGSNFVTNGIEGYSSHFSHCKGEKVIFEATAEYIHSPLALKEISKLPSQPKVLFFLREPASRLYSHYTFERYRTGRFKGDFDDYINDGKRYVRGEYVHRLKEWKAALGDSRIKIILFEDLIKAPVNTMKEIANWLEIDPKFYDDFSFTKRNETVAVKNHALHNWGVKVQKFIPHWVQEFLLPIYLKINGGKKPQKSNDDQLKISELRKRYHSSVTQLEALFPQVDFSIWH